MVKRKTYIEKKEDEIRELLSDKKRQTKYINQLNRRGWSDMDIWDLDYTFAEFIVPRLKELKKNKFGIITVFENDDEKKTMKRWDAIFNEMIEGFEIVLDDNRWRLIDKKQKKVDKALENFVKYFDNLWY